MNISKVSTVNPCKSHFLFGNKIDDSIKKNTSNGDSIDDIYDCDSFDRLYFDFIDTFRAVTKKEIKNLIEEGIIDSTCHVTPVNDVLKGFHEIESGLIDYANRYQVTGINEEGNIRIISKKINQDTEEIRDKKPFRVLYFKDGLLSRIRKSDIELGFENGVLKDATCLDGYKRRDYHFSTDAISFDRMNL